MCGLRVHELTVGLRACCPRLITSAICDNIGVQPEDRRDVRHGSNLLVKSEQARAGSLQCGLRECHPRLGSLKPSAGVLQGPFAVGDVLLRSNLVGFCLRHARAHGKESLGLLCDVLLARVQRQRCVEHFGLGRVLLGKGRVRGRLGFQKAGNRGRPSR